ncbi:MAG: sigma-70 family RNA polymerase sigma factor [Tepidisphaera sp.]|nr:sigma-70 family RNA polymerase sigma factor [Tepidisphaera sp.]
MARTIQRSPILRSVFAHYSPSVRVGRVALRFRALGAADVRVHSARVESEHRTTAVVQQYLDGLAGESPAEPIVRELLARSVERLRMLCASMLYRDYARLTRPPLNLEPEELLGGLVERLLKAMRETRPPTVRQFFGLANQHIRWELNGLARSLDDRTRDVGIREELVPAPEPSASGLSPNTIRMLDAIESLPAEEREVFELVRVQGMTYVEAAGIIGVTDRTIHRRLSRSLVLLSQRLADLGAQAIDAPAAEERGER